MVCQEYIIVCPVTYCHQEHIRDVPIPLKHVVIARRVMHQQGYTFWTWFQFNPSPYWWTIRGAHGAHCHSQRHKEAWGVYDVPRIYIRGKHRRNYIAPQEAIPKTRRFLTVWFILRFDGLLFIEVFNNPNNTELPSNRTSVPYASLISKHETLHRTTPREYDKPRFRKKPHRRIRL